MTILPKAEMAGEENESKMIQAESKKNSYFFDYTAKTPGQPKVRQESIVSSIAVLLLTWYCTLLLDTLSHNIFSFFSSRLCRSNVGYDYGTGTRG
jgi:hypothetical protein